MSYGGVGALGAEVQNPLWQFQKMGQGFSVPGTPKCVDQSLFAGIAGCLADPSKPGCASYVQGNGAFTQVGAALAALPLCFHPDMPTGCRSSELDAGVQYCEQYGYGGPNKTLNALCWGAMKDASYFGNLRALPTCGTHEEQLPVTPADKTKRAMMWGGLLLLVAVAGGYLVYRQTKKPGKRRRNWRYLSNTRHGHPSLSSGARGRARRRAFAAALDSGLSRRQAARAAVTRVPLSQAEQIGVALQTGKSRAA